MMQGDECLKQLGAYVLLIELKDKFEGHVGRLGDITLPAGGTVTLAAPVA